MRSEWRVYGAAVGMLPSCPTQSTAFSLPVVLLPEEAALLLELGAAQLFDGATPFAAASAVPAPAPSPPAPAPAQAGDQSAQAPATVRIPTASLDDPAFAAAAATPLPADALGFPQTDDDRLRLFVFRDLWQRGHYMTAGLKFGGDYLVYPGDPELYHAHFVALVQRHNQGITPLQLVALGRLATAVKKTFLVCSRDAQGQAAYLSIEWTNMV